MKALRHALFHSSLVRLAVAACLAGSSAAIAAEFPERPVRIVVPFAAGASMDIATRIIAEPMAKLLGQPVLAENRPGANATIGAAAVATAPADGYTTLFSILPSLTSVFTKDLTFDASTDLVPVGGVFSASFVMFTSAEVPAKTLKEFIEYVKARPGKVNYGVPALTTMLSMEMLKNSAGIDMVAVNYKGGAPARTALLANEVQALFNVASVHKADVDSGKARALFVAGDRRVNVLPNVPTAAEAGYPDLLTTNTGGVWAPKATPREVILKLNAAINEALRDPKLAQYVDSTGGVVFDGRTPEAFGRVAGREVQFWSKAAKLANYQPQ